jgi:predicted MFS family arabinose efflux permease
LWDEPIVRFLAFLASGLNFVWSSVPLIVIVIAKKLGAADSQIGLIFSIAGVGGIIGSVIGSQVQKRFTFGQAVRTIAWGLLVLFLSFTMVPHFFLLGVIAATSFMLITIYNVLSISYRLALIPEELQGRVNSAFRFLAFAFRPIGMTIGGFLLDHFGSSTTIVLFSFWLLALAILTTSNQHIQRARPIGQPAAE